MGLMAVGMGLSGEQQRAESGRPVTDSIPIPVIALFPDAEENTRTKLQAIAE